MFKLRKIISIALFLFLIGLSFADESPEDLESQDNKELNNNFDNQTNQKKSSINEEIQKEFNIIMPSQNFNLNPHSATYSSEGQLLDALYEGLYSYDPKTLDPKPALATACKISRDKKKLTFTIRENAKFSDGTPLNAFSIRNSWIMLLSTPNAPYASFLDCIKGVEDFRAGKISEKELGIVARDNKTFIVYLVKPTAHFNRIICHHAFTIKNSADNVFSGAFVIKERTENYILLEKNPNYWDSKNVHLPSIKITTSDDIVENAWSFNLGRTNWITSVFDGNKILNRNVTKLSAIFGTEYLFFNCKRSPWNNANFRNALITAVPWSELRKSSFVQAQTLVYPLANYPKVEGLTATEVEDALDMMKEARKNANISENKIIDLHFCISATSDRQKRFYEILKKAWEPLGVNLIADIVIDYKYLDTIEEGSSDIFVYSWIGDFADPLAFLELFREKSTLNKTVWKNDKYQTLLENASETNDIMEHYKFLSQAEQVLLDDGVIMPISHSISYHAISSDEIGGWYTNALDIHPYKYLYFKEYKTNIPNVVMGFNHNK